MSQTPLQKLCSTMSESTRKLAAVVDSLAKIAVKKCLVLVVEDDRDTRSALQQVFLSEGYEVAVAENGEQALLLLKTMHPNAIVLDLMMPVMDGWEFRRRQSAVSSAPVVTLSASSDKPPPSEAFFRKPVDIARLLAAVDRLCHI